MLVLGIESSCDDTGAAVLENNCVISNVLTSQDSVHARFGGVVPELASRSHLQAIGPMVQAALDQAGKTLDDIDLIAATQGPGLIGSLLVGFSYAKSLSYVRKIPLVGVDHMAGHILSVHLGQEIPEFPYVALIVSGGTTSIFLAESFTSFTLLGRTRDDAAGEAFDKVAKLLDLGYPGGPLVSAKAQDGDSSAIRFPRAWLEEGSLDFSFSGLKTSVLTLMNQVRQPSRIRNKATAHGGACAVAETDRGEKTQHSIADICASFQQAVVDVLVEKTMRAARMHGVRSVVIGGGVSANGCLRLAMQERCKEEQFAFFAPPLKFCTDNGAMIGFAGYQAYLADPRPAPMDIDVFSRSQLG